MDFAEPSPDIKLDIATEGSQLVQHLHEPEILTRSLYLRIKFSSSLGDANKSIATKKILPWGSSKNRHAMFIPTLSPNQGVCTLPVTLTCV